MKKESKNKGYLGVTKKWNDREREVYRLICDAWRLELETGDVFNSEVFDMLNELKIGYVEDKNRKYYK